MLVLGGPRPVDLPKSPKGDTGLRAAWGVG
jgi:hypothetical protein